MNDQSSIIAELQPIWVSRGCPETGPVFISSKKKPYSNPEGMGGNPLTKAQPPPASGRGSPISACMIGVIIGLAGWSCRAAIYSP